MSLNHSDRASWPPGGEPGGAGGDVGVAIDVPNNAVALDKEAVVRLTGRLDVGNELRPNLSWRRLYSVAVPGRLSTVNRVVSWVVQCLARLGRHVAAVDGDRLPSGVGDVVGQQEGN